MCIAKCNTKTFGRFYVFYGVVWGTCESNLETGHKDKIFLFYSYQYYTDNIFHFTKKFTDFSRLEYK